MLAKEDNARVQRTVQEKQVTNECSSTLVALVLLVLLVPLLLLVIAN